MKARRMRLLRSDGQYSQLWLHRFVGHAELKLYARRCEDEAPLAAELAWDPFLDQAAAETFDQRRGHLGPVFFDPVHGQNFAVRIQHPAQINAAGGIGQRAVFGRIGAEFIEDQGQGQNRRGHDLHVFALNGNAAGDGIVLLDSAADDAREIRGFQIRF